MIKVTRDGKEITVSDERVAEMLIARHGFKAVTNELEDVKHKLDAMNIKYHPQLGLKKLKLLLEE